MPQVSRYKLDQRTEIQLVKTFQMVMAKINKQEEMSFFLSALFTPTEKIMLAKRLAIITFLKDGLSDSEIASALHVTRMTVAKMRYFFESRGQGYKIALQKIAREKDLQILKDLLWEVARRSIRAAGGRV